MGLTLDKGVEGVQRREMIPFLGGELAPLELSLDSVAVVDQEDVLCEQILSVRTPDIPR